jgi:N-glycosylase/DNA lyase
MIEKLCELYGTQAPIKFGNFFDFPTIPQLIANLPGMEQKLRESGFGYRAASISKTVQMLANAEWINKEFGVIKILF